MKYGRKPRIYDPRVPEFSALGAVPVALPQQVDYDEHMPRNLGFMLNENLGDCTCAAVGHAIQVWSFNAAGAMVTPTDKQIEVLYERTGGYVPGDPNTDQGAIEQVVLQYWLQNPVDKNKLAAFIEIEPTSDEHMRQAIYECGAVYIGLNVPSYLQNLENAGDTWDVCSHADNTIVGGHCVIAVGYDPEGNLIIISWGMRFKMTPAFVTQFVDEAYALADREWIKRTGKSPGGLTLAELEALMQPMQWNPPGYQRQKHRHLRRRKKLRRR
jgi:hypothetical protein